MQHVGDTVGAGVVMVVQFVAGHWHAGLVVIVMFVDIVMFDDELEDDDEPLEQAAIENI